MAELGASYRFDPAAYTRFECTRLDVEFSTGAVAWSYALDGPHGRMEFTEELTLPLPDGSISPKVGTAVTDVLRLAHRVAGVSYFKAAAPSEVRLGEPVTAAELAFLDGVYHDGLAEFAYANGLPSVLETDIVATVVEAHQGREPTGQPLVPCGGGKDSIVSLERLRDAGFDPVSFVVNPNAITRSVVERSGARLLAVSRRLDKKLFTLNDTGAHNGHIPVTAINSLLAIAVATLHGLGPVVMSNESSASEPNLTWQGRPVNHQWSKGIDAERLLREAVASRLGPGERYFSLLRSLNELTIASLFASVEGYDDVVTSCNRAFTIIKPKPLPRGETAAATSRWCRDCPKCRFVFLALAGFVDADRLIAIFGGDMLRDESQLHGYRELLGLTAFKPFECVGELDESVAAAVSLAGHPKWHDADVLRALVAEVEAGNAPVPPLGDVLARRGATLAPPDYLAVLDAAR